MKPSLLKNDTQATGGMQEDFRWDENNLLYITLKYVIERVMHLFLQPLLISGKLSDFVIVTALENSFLKQIYLV